MNVVCFEVILFLKTTIYLYGTFISVDDNDKDDEHFSVLCIASIIKALKAILGIAIKIISTIMFVFNNIYIQTHYLRNSSLIRYNIPYTQHACGIISDGYPRFTLRV